MFYNYLKIAIRNILKYKVFSFINIFGLAVAMTGSMLIILMLADQKSYDQFNINKNRIYRILTKEKDSSTPYATSPFPLAKTLKTDYPIIEQSTHLVMGVGGDITYNNNTRELRGFFTEPAFFDLFSYELEKGDKKTALNQPNSMIVTSEFAELFFGDVNPIGNTVEFKDRGLFLIDLDFVATDTPPTSWGRFKITGVLADKNYKSHLNFDVLISSSSLPLLYEERKIEDPSDNWKDCYLTYSYVLLKHGNNLENLNSSLGELASRTYTNMEDAQITAFFGQKLTEITPGAFLNNPSSFRLPIEVYYFLAFLAFILIILACLNYTNLSIARAITRAREIGIRKVMGAKRGSIFLQFINESIVTVLFALLMAIFLLHFIKSGFENLWLNRFLNFELQANGAIYLTFIGFALVVGSIAGLFPALRLSKYNPVHVLKNIETSRRGKLGLRKSISISQFVVSLFFIVTSLLIYNQVQHFLRFEYGFKSKNILNIDLQGNDFKIISNELCSVPGVSAISGSEYLPATGISNGKHFRKMNEEEDISIQLLSADEQFADNIGLKILAGRNLPEANGNEERYVLINESAVKKLGYETPSNAIGQILVTQKTNEVVEVIGVVKDFYFQSPMFSDKIGPFMLQNRPEKFRYANLRIASNNMDDTIQKLHNTWKNLDPVHPFNYHFYDEQLVAINQMLGDLLTILSFVAFMAATIACLGLLSMAMYTTERHRKEIGIRKVLGATELRITFLLSNEFLKMLIISIIIAAPLSYFVNNAWLQNFPNQVEFGLSTILLGSAILLALGLITVGSQTLKAAISNPVDSLRTE